MKKHDKQWACSLAAFAVLGVLGDSAHADGYRNPPPTAAGIGKSGVNRVFVDDASAISYNSANLTTIEGGSFVVDNTLAHTENSYNNPLNPAGNVDSKDEWVLLPSLYASTPVGDNGMVLGLGITTPYGQGLEWAAADVFDPVAPVSIYQAELMLININPTVAFKISDRISVGLGANIYYSELELNALSAAGDEIKAEGDDVGFGGNIGVTWQMTDRQRVALTYQSEVDLNYEGDLSVTPGILLTSSSFGLGVTYPNILAAGYGVELTDDIRIEANVEWLEWSSSKTQVADLGVNGSIPMPQNWENTFTFGVGGEWQVNENWTLRSGYAFIETPIPDATLSPILPDADRHALSFGLGYETGAHAFDVAYTFSFYDDRATSLGTYDIDSDLVGLTYSLSY